MDFEKVGDILLPDPTTHEIGDKEPAQVAKWVNGFYKQLSEPCSCRAFQGRREGFAHNLVYMS